MAVTSTIASKVNWRESPPTLNNELDPIRPRDRWQSVTTIQPGHPGEES